MFNFIKNNIVSLADVVKSNLVEITALLGLFIPSYVALKIFRERKKTKLLKEKLEIIQLSLDRVLKLKKEFADSVAKELDSNNEISDETITKYEDELMYILIQVKPYLYPDEKILHKDMMNFLLKPIFETEKFLEEKIIEPVERCFKGSPNNESEMESLRNFFMKQKPRAKVKGLLCGGINEFFSKIETNLIKERESIIKQLYNRHRPPNLTK